MATLRVKLLSENATLPKRASDGSAGYDLSSAYALTVQAHGTAVARTDLSISVPSGTYGRIAPRSSLALLFSIDVGAGVIDIDFRYVVFSVLVNFFFRGNVGIVLFNHSNIDFKIEIGDRVAQLILEKIEIAEVVEVCELEDTKRGSGGFGSTGASKFAKTTSTQ